MRKISFYTQGCRLNQAETATITNGFSATEFQAVHFSEPADISVINTCTVTENGDNDTRKLVNRLIRLNPKVQIALIGCQSQILKEKLLKFPNIKWVIGNTDKMSLSSIITTTQDTPDPILQVSKLTKESVENMATDGTDSQHTRVNLKIQDGCDFYCSFCIIPFARGPARSLPFDALITQATQLSESHKEIVLTGINLGTYEHNGQKLEDVIHALETLPKLERIRISSIEPTTISNEIIQKMKDPKSKLCAYLHIPIQSGSDTILKKMSRNYDTSYFKAFINDIRKQLPDVCIGTDIMVGFPGETEVEFEETLQLLSELPMDYFHVFSYSERSLARSKKLPDKVDKPIIAQRSQILRDLSARKKASYYTNTLGKTLPVLFEQEKKGFWIGTTEHFVKVKVKSEMNLKNEIKLVTLTSLEKENTLGILC